MRKVRMARTCIYQIGTVWRFLRATSVTNILHFTFISFLLASTADNLRPYSRLFPLTRRLPYSYIIFRALSLALQFNLRILTTP